MENSFETNEETFDVVIIGAGFAGLISAIQLKKAGYHNFVILEKTSAVGGTWRDNIYPGCACDIPAELYSLAEEDWHWKEAYTAQPGVLDYIRYLVDKHELDKDEHFRFRQVVSGMEFQEHESRWIVQTECAQQYTGQHVIVAVGQLHLPMIPQFKHSQTFKGKTFHTAQFRSDYENVNQVLESLRNKRVAVIGSGASAIQVIPEVAKVASHVECYQRTQNHVCPKIIWTMYAVTNSSSWSQKAYRYLLSLIMEHLIFGSIRGNPLCYAITRGMAWLNLWLGTLGHSQLSQQLTPTKPFLSDRLLYSNSYYPALCRPNVHVTCRTDIERLDDRGIVDANGTHVPVDVIIYATGFDPNPWKFISKSIRGRNGRDIWSDRLPRAFLGVHTHGFPNLHFLYGPNTNTGHTSVLLFVESQVDLIVRGMKRLKQTGRTQMEVEKQVEEDFLKEVNQRFRGLTFSRLQNSQYIYQGRNIRNWMGGAPEYQRRCKEVNWESAYEWR